MPVLGVKVVAPFSGRGVYLASLLLGIISGPVMTGVETWEYRIPQSRFVRSHLSPGGAHALALILTIGAAFVPAMLIGLWLSCLSQRRAQVAVAAGIAGAAWLLTGLFTNKVLWSSDGGTDWQGWPVFGFLFNLVIITLFSAGVALLIRWLVRVLLFTVQEQDGSRCPRCAYALGSPSITICPECGTPADSSRLAFARLTRVTGWVRRGSPVVGGILVVAVVAQLVVTVRFRTIPALRFLGAFPAAQDPILGYMTRHDDFNGTNPTCPARWVTVPGDPSRVVVILYIPDRRDALPAMRLAVAATPGPPPPGNAGVLLNYGSPQVACDLSREMAECVIGEGIPPGLIERLSSEASRANWAPAPSAVGVFVPGVQTIWIDPASFFSEARARP